MTKDVLKDLFLRDLDRLENEVKLYPNQESMWAKVDGISNTGGNLIMHLVGNLQHFIGATLYESGYVRDRANEFEGSMTSGQMLEEIAKTKSIIEAYFIHVDEASFLEEYPMQVFGEPMTILYFLNHLYGHLNYHLGQVNYHRRILAI